MKETTIIDATELPADEQRDLATSMIDSINTEAGMRHDAVLDRLSEDSQSITTEWQGDTLAEAKGRALKTRDTVEKATDREATVEHTGRGWKFPSTTFYEFEITVK